jgi:ammonia channel protein AmtB
LHILSDLSTQKQIFASHAIGGIVGNICTAIFAQARVAAYDGFTVIPGGWLDRHWIQLPWHIADSTAGLSYSFAMTVRKFLYFPPKSKKLPFLSLFILSHLVIFAY